MLQISLLLVKDVLTYSWKRQWCSTNLFFCVNLCIITIKCQRFIKKYYFNTETRIIPPVYRSATLKRLSMDYQLNTISQILRKWVIISIASKGLPPLAAISCEHTHFTYWSCLTKCRLQQHCTSLQSHSKSLSDLQIHAVGLTYHPRCHHQLKEGRKN